MTERDALGRRRAPGQDRGLRPLYPPLPRGVSSRAVRVAMSGEAWVTLDGLLASDRARTTPRAIGELLERAVRSEHERRAGIVDWQEWQIHKERRLLARRGPDEAAAS